MAEQLIIKCKYLWNGEVSEEERKLKEGVTEIGKFAFAAKMGLTEVVIPEGVTEIGRCAFMECKKLIKVTIPKSVDLIAEGAFYGCNELEENITISRDAEVGRNAFFGNYHKIRYYDS